jgi:cell division septation protein DedD
MDPALKHRLIGAAVLSALAIIFLPMLIVGRDKNNIAADAPLTMPGAPNGDFQTRELPLVTPAAGIPKGGVVGMDASHPAPLASGASTVPAVDVNGLPVPVGAQPASAQSVGAVAASAVPSVVPVANPNAAGTTAPAVALPTTATPGIAVPAASAGGHYVVSLGTYSNTANAQSLVASLKGAQLPAYAEAVSVAGKPSTRVRIGPFAQRGDAEAARLRAQQVRTDMPASVTALDAATPAPDTVTAPANKPTTAPPIAPAVAKPLAPTGVTTPKPVVPSVSTAASAAVKPPAAPSPAAAGRGYVVQVSAFRSQDEALTLRDKLRAAGFTAFSEKIQADSGTLYRVRIGPEADRDAADRLRTELSTKLGLSGMVVAYP